MLVIMDSQPVRWWHSSPPDSALISLSYRPNSSVHLFIHLIMPCFCLCSTPMAKGDAGTSNRAELFSVFNMYTIKYSPIMTCEGYVGCDHTAAATT